MKERLQTSSDRYFFLCCCQLTKRLSIIIMSSIKLPPRSVNRGPRGITPNKGKPPPPTTSLTAAPNTDFSGLPAEGLNLDPEEELKVWERLEKGDFKAGEGWQQFLNKENNNPSNSTRQNLSNAFNAAADATLASDPSSASQNQELTLDEEFAQFNISRDKLPHYMQSALELMEEVDNLRTIIYRTIDAIIDNEFAEMFPQNRLANLSIQVEEAMRILEGMMSSPKVISGYTGLLMKTNPGSPRKCSIPCPIKMQQECIQTFLTLSKNLENVNSFLENDSPLKLEANVENLEVILKDLENDMEVAEKSAANIQKYKEIIKEIGSSLWEDDTETTIEDADSSCND